MDTNHPRPFTIEADFMNDDEMQELLEELVRSFRQGYTEAIHDEGLTEQDRQKIIDTANRSWETLNSLFRNQAGLTHEFLSNQNNSETVILERLKEWAIAVIAGRPGAADNLRFSFVANDLVECKNQLDALTTTPSGGESPAIWPFIKLIRCVYITVLYIYINELTIDDLRRVYLQSPVLRTGLILADLPGTCLMVWDL